MKYFILALTVFLMVCGNAWGLSFDNEITVNDGIVNSSYDGGSPALGIAGEDNETETNANNIRIITNQSWDLEGMFIDGNNIIVVGGFNFENGYDNISIGNLFFGDLNGGNFTSKYGLDDNGNIYENLTTSNTIYVPQSNPYKVTGGTDTNYDWSVSYGLVDGLFSDWSDDSQNPGDYGTDHYYMQFTIADNNFWNMIYNDPESQYVHLTMECGNDTIRGQVAPVPEPTTILLSGLGLMGMGFYLKKKMFAKGIA